MADVFIFHGLGGNSKENWFPWLERQLEAVGCRVVVPDFPDSDNPKLNKWLAHLSGYEIGNGAILVGHSLGCPFILNVLERLDRKVKAVFLVAGFVGLLGISDIDSRVMDIAERDFDWKKIKGCCRRFYVLASDNDPYVPLAKARQLASLLSGKLVILKSGAHFNGAEFPELLDLVKNEF